MATTTRNKAAEKFVEDFRTGGPDDFPNTAAQLDLRLQRICDEERRLVIKRIRAAVADIPGQPLRKEVLDILDEVAS